MSKDPKTSQIGGSHPGPAKPVQVKNPIIDRWVKLDIRTGRILDTKKVRGHIRVCRGAD